ncbi:glycoside hydrolase family 43 protein [Auriculariales sp. MPI-PUGE-AT-0066]|nr:glycoside hydrolase family 43 protein [Auriculariales sp. MPI-PUGE-AT-0066]
MLFRVVAIIAAAAAGVRAVVGPGVVTGYTSVHDPSMCKVGSTYYLFSTGVGIPILTSTDRTAWKLLGLVWPNGASWTDAYTGASNANLWAPDCYYDGSKLYVYYAASSFGSQNSAIFLAYSTTFGPGSYTNAGLAIDPAIYVENGLWYLAWGSFWQGIYSASLNPSTGKLYNSSSTHLAARSSTALEGSTIYKYGSYYYLFASWDKCCSGTSSTYNIKVGRSSSIWGPYVDSSGVQLLSGGGTNVLASHDSIIGPGGQDVYTDGDGSVLVYHYYTSSGSWLGINLLNFTYYDDYVYHE